MSMERTESVTCPKCGKASDFIIWESLNADIDPEAQQQLIDGSIFHFTCPECGHKSNVNYGMLYHCNLRSPTATGAVANGHSAVRQRPA